MSASEIRGSELFVRGMLRSVGLSVEEVFADAGMDPAALGEGFLGYAEAMRLWSSVERLSKDPLVGHRSGAQLRLNDLGVVATSFSHAPDLRAGLLGLGRMLPLAMPNVSFRVEEDEEGVAIIYQTPGLPETPRHGVESMFAGILSLSRQSVRRAFEVSSIALETDAPLDPSIYDEFYGQKVRWEADVCVMRISTADAATPMVGADPQLAQLLNEHAPQLLRIGADDDQVFEQRVARAFWSSVDEGDPTIAGAARRCGMSARTLQRRLSTAGLSFSDLREQLVKGRACALLRDESLSVEQVASVVGYESRASFDRAFRRWTGQSPAKYRRG